MLVQYRHHAKTIIVLLILSIVILLPNPSHAASNTVRLYVAPASTSTTVGSTTTVQIRLEKNSSSRVEYVNTTLLFPLRLLNVTSISKNGSQFSNGNGPTITYSNSNGTVTVQGSGPSLPARADVLVATIMFVTRTSGTAALTFSSDSQVGNLLGGGNVKNYLTSTSPAAISIANPPTSVTKPSQPKSPTPSAQPSSPAPTPAETAPTASGLEPQEDNLPLIERPTAKATLASPTATKSVAFVMSSLVGLGVFAAGAAWLLLWSRRIEASTKLPASTAPANGTDVAESERAEAAILAAAAQQRTNEHPTIHSVETVQHHPMLPSAKQKHRRSPAAPTEKPVPTITQQAGAVSPASPSPAPKAQVQVEPSVASPAPQEPIDTPPSAPASEPEDMFEAGEKRLKLEGLDSSPKETSPEKGSRPASR